MKNKKWVRLLAYVTGTVNQELLLQNEYLAAENRILRAKLPSRLRLSNPERATLAEIGKRLGRKAARNALFKRHFISQPAKIAVRTMTERVYGGIGYLLFSLIALAAQDVVTAVEGTVKKVDSGTKTVVVKTADGAEHTFHFLGRTVVHGTEATVKGSKDAFHGLKEGSEVAVHYTAKGGRETADEVDHIGKDGLKVTEGTISHIDRGAKTVAVKTADGTEETYRLADRAVKDTGKDIGEGAEKSAKVTVYYTEEGGHKVAHFLKKTF